MKKSATINGCYSIAVNKTFLTVKIMVILLIVTIIQGHAAETISQDNKKEISPQQASITGKVTDSGGNPLPGVNVVEKGTTNGTVTDLDGKYAITVSTKEAKLEFSFLGYLTENIEVDGKSMIDITLVEDILSLDEVVVTALGIKREEKALGYSVQKVNGEGLQTVKGVNVSTSLTGKVAGLLIQNSTEFNAIDTIHIRGETPLLVIDGVPYGNMTLRDIPSDDIEDISILKGATASALYGFRGQSGAIMITTKSGSLKKGFSVTVNSSSMFAAGFLAIPEIQSTYGRLVDGATNTYTGLAQGAWGPPMEGQEVIQWDPISKTYKPMPYLPIGKDNFKNFLEQGYILNNNVSMVQQGEFGSVRSSISWVDNKGIYPNSNLNKITYTMGGDMKVNKFSLSSNMSFNKHISPNVGFSDYTGYDPMYSLLVWSSPDWDIRQYKDYWLVPNEIQNNSYSAGNNNPYFDRYERIHSTNRDIFNGSLAMTYDFLPWLKLTIRSGFDTYSDKQVVRISKGSFQGGGSSTVIRYGKQIWGESKLGSYNVGLGRGYSINNDVLLMANKTFKDLTIDGLLGGTIYYTNDEGIQAFTQGGLTIPAFYSLKASVNPVDVRSNTRKQQVNSMYGRLGLSWKSLLFLDGTLRTDWSSTFYGISSVQETKYYSYPSLSTSFVVSELLPEMSWLSLWKLRASWTAAKKPASPYAINQVYNITPLAWENLSSAALPGSIRSSNVQPEASSTYEIGTAINVYKNRASLDIAYYNKRMYNFLDEADMTPAAGFSSNYINTDEERIRKGVEITLNVTPVKTTDWNWNVSFNWSRYAEYYTQLDSIYSDDKPWVKVGERTDHYTIREFQRDPDGNIIHSAGLPLYSNYYSLFGYSNPDWIWGLNTSVRYKKFILSLSVDGRVGGLTKTMTENYMWRTGNHPNSVVPERYLDATESGGHYIGDGVQVVSGEATYDTYGNITSDTRVYAENDVAVLYKQYVNILHTNNAWGGAASSLDVYSTTFFKVREVSLTYMLPKDFTARFTAKSASISLVGQNLFLWAKDFKYSDPDGGRENFSDPSVRYIGGNIKVTF